MARDMGARAPTRRPPSHSARYPRSDGNSGPTMPGIAAQLGHDATMTLSTYAHVVAELRDAPKLGADEQIRTAQRALAEAKCGPYTAHEPIPGQLTMFDIAFEHEKAPQMRGFDQEPTGGLEPPTPSLRVMCSTS